MDGEIQPGFRDRASGASFDLNFEVENPGVVDCCTVACSAL
jgi:hypothetical protein